MRGSAQRLRFLDEAIGNLVVHVPLLAKIDYLLRRKTLHCVSDVRCEFSLDSLVSGMQRFGHVGSAQPKRMDVQPSTARKEGRVRNTIRTGDLPLEDCKSGKNSVVGEATTGPTGYARQNLGIARHG